jgi:ribosomal-protein-alanine N-acetyltransferase
MHVDDVEAVHAIERVSFSDPWSPRAFAMEASEKAGRSWAWVAELGGDVGGYLIAWPVEDEVHLANIAVAKGLRRRGIGRFLMEKLIERARANGAAWISLEVRASNASARNLYEEIGFRPVAIRKNYYRSESEDAVVMMCRLRGLEAGETEV